MKTLSTLAVVRFHLWRAGRLLDAGRLQEACLLMARITAALNRIEAA